MLNSGLSKFATLLVVGLAATSAKADEAAQSVIITGGSDWAKDSETYYAGILVALNRDFSRDGLIFRTYGNIGQYDYDTDSVASGNVNVDYRAFDVMLGYQKSVGDITGTLYLGVDHQEHDDKPNDFESDLRGIETGFKIAGDIATGDETPLFVGADASYSTAFDTFESQLRVGYNMKWLVLGVEGAYYNVVSDDTERLGGFATFKFHASPNVPVELTLNGGHQFVSESDDGEGNSFSGGEGTYGGTNLSFSF